MSPLYSELSNQQAYIFSELNTHRVSSLAFIVLQSFLFTESGNTENTFSKFRKYASTQTWRMTIVFFQEVQTDPNNVPISFFARVTCCVSEESWLQRKCLLHSVSTNQKTPMILRHVISFYVCEDSITRPAYLLGLCQKLCRW